MSIREKLSQHKTYLHENVNPEPVFIKQVCSLTLPIYRFNIKNDLDLDKTIQSVRRFREQYPDNHTTNVHAQTGWRSMDGIEKLTNDFDSITDIMQQKVRLIEKTINNGTYFDTSILEAWTIIYKQNDFTNWHHHYPQLPRGGISWTCTLYLTDSTCPIVFKQDKLENLEIIPTAGTLCIFSPLAMHMVPKLQDDGERIVVAANIGRRGINV